MQRTARRDVQTRGAMLLLASTALAACGGGTSDDPALPKEPELTAATLGEQNVLAPAQWLATEPYAAADRDAGERQARVCLACHSIAEGGANMIGPNLYGFFGRKAGAVEAFDYSSAIEETDFVWTPRALDAWLRQPARFMPGNRMTYPGVPKKQDRDNLIAYLLTVTSDAGAAKEEE